MTRTESVEEYVTDIIEDIEDIEVVKPIEPGSLEWFRLNAPLPLLLRAFFEDAQNREEMACYANDTALSACENCTGFWTMLDAVQEEARCLEDSDDPNAKAIVARLRSLMGPTGLLFAVE